MASTRRRAFLLLTSCALSIVLIALLIRIGKIDLRLTLQQLESVRPASLIKLLLLNVALVMISTEKWRCIDTALRRSSDSVQSRTTSFALTSAGLALGTFLPVQFAMATARTLGTFVHGSPIRRGTAGTLYEQSFDILAFGLLAAASAITWFSRGARTTWGISAVLLTSLALVTAGPAARLICWLAAAAARLTAPESRIGALLRDFSQLLHSGLLSASLARYLVLLSVGRFVVVVLMSIQTAEAIGLHIPLWHMAAAIPFVVFASIIVPTPGGLGVNELTYAGSLNLFGTPLSIGAQWALANRVLIAVSYLIVAICAATAPLLAKAVVSNDAGALQD